MYGLNKATQWLHLVHAACHACDQQVVQVDQQLDPTNNTARMPKLQQGLLGRA
jgi:hypothetical protein